MFGEGLASGKLASLSLPLASSDLRKDPEGVWNQALFMLRGMLRRPVSPDRISSKFHDVTHPKFPPDFTLLSIYPCKSSFFLIRHVFPVFSSIFLVSEGIGEKKFHRYFHANSPSWNTRVAIVL